MHSLHALLTSRTAVYACLNASMDSLDPYTSKECPARGWWVGGTMIAATEVWA